MISVDAIYEWNENDLGDESYQAQAIVSKGDLLDIITRLREAEKDAERYQWLRDRVCMFYVSAEGCDSKDAYLTVTGYGDDDSRAVVDAAIDEQMKEKGDE